MAKASKAAKITASKKVTKVTASTSTVRQAILAGARKSKVSAYEFRAVTRKDGTKYVTCYVGDNTPKVRNNIALAMDTAGISVDRINFIPTSSYRLSVNVRPA